MEEERKKILEMIEAGTVTAEQGMALMNALDQKDEPAEQASFSPEPPPDLAGHWPLAWLYVLYAGVGLLVVGGLLLLLVYTGGSVWWGLCGWPLFLSGVLAAAVGAWSRTARWLHVRVTGRDHRVAISMPLPLRLAAWGVKLAQRFAPDKFRQTGLDEVIMGLDDSLGESGKPFYVDVTDDQDGEHVQVYIG